MHVGELVAVNCSYPIQGVYLQCSRDSLQLILHTDQEKTVTENA